MQLIENKGQWEQFKESSVHYGDVVTGHTDEFPFYIQSDVKDWITQSFTYTVYDRTAFVIMMEVFDNES